MNKRQLLQNLKENTYCRLGISKIHGVGVFAIRDIPKGIDPLIGSFRGDYVKFSKKDLSKLDSSVKQLIKDYFVEIDGKIHVPTCGLNGIDLSFFMNHSKNPNIIPDLETDKCFAICDIKTGEELTFNYIEYCGENPDEVS